MMQPNMYINGGGNDKTFHVLLTYFGFRFGLLNTFIVNIFQIVTEV